MKKIYRRISYIGLGMIPLISCTLKSSEGVSSPNVIYVFPDQMRNSAMGFWNDPPYSGHIRFKTDPVKTPYLNKFAGESVVFTSAFSNCPLSSPHRGSLMTGMYPDKSGVTLNCNSTRPVSSLPDDAITISDIYRQAGYECAYIGKYHLDYPTLNDPDNPGRYVNDADPEWDAYTPPEKRHGFNYWYSYGTFDVHKRPHYWDTEGKRHEINEWSPKHETDKAIEYLENKSGKRDKSKPFFLMIGFNPPHHPYNSLNDCMEEDYYLYKGIPLGKLLVRDNADTTLVKAHSAPYYFAQITGVDRQFGRLLEALGRLKLSENTIVVFSSDHGETMCSHGLTDPKNSPYTESVNTPFIIRYPGKIKPRVTNQILSSPDIMPTLLGLCGLEDKIPAKVQGYNHSNTLLTGNPDGQAPQSALYIRNEDGEKDADARVISCFPVARGIKTENYTLVFSIDPRNKRLRNTLFFDDQTDPYQLKNLDIDSDPEVKDRLLHDLAGLLKGTGDPWYSGKILSDIIPYD